MQGAVLPAASLPKTGLTVAIDRGQQYAFGCISHSSGLRRSLCVRQDAGVRVTSIARGWRLLPELVVGGGGAGGGGGGGESRR